MFPKHTSLIKLTYFAFTLAGLINAKGSIFGFIYMAYQWILINTSCFVTYTELVVGSREIQELVQTLSAAIVSSLDLTKLVLFAIRRKKIRKLLDRLEDIRLTMLNDQENSHFITEAETFGRKYLKTIFYFFISFPFPSFVLHTVIESMSNFKHKKLLVNAWFRWNREKVWAHILTNGLITLITQTIMTISVGFYFMEITYTTYTSVYIKILRLIDDYNEILSGQIYLEAVITPLVPCGFGLSFLRST
ncbi:hypothetical protein O3M35_002590 [Rhynocoris fuscipes]|uniref:Uncharacterized protein n=1 Tax=Rhynocoris fuscipes TaxID=488301 RepID=A0AAW1CTG9_9HEMI